MTAGIVYYKPEGNNLSGHWSHESIAGRLARETIIGASLDALEGIHTVELEDPESNPYYSAELSISRLGECYRMSWKGELTKTKQKLAFVGIGYVVGGMLIATFELAKVENGVGIWHEDLATALAGVPNSDGYRFSERLSRGSARLLVYAPYPKDPQEPHRKDEVYIVASGNAVCETDQGNKLVKAGDALFVAAGERHKFIDLSANFSSWVIFYGPDGGE